MIKGMEVVFAMDLSQVSLLHALVYIKSGRDFNTLINVKNGAQQDKIVGGSSTLPLKLAQELENNIKLNTMVKIIDDQGQYVRIVTDKGDEYKCE